MEVVHHTLCRQGGGIVQGAACGSSSCGRRVTGGSLTGAQRAHESLHRTKRAKRKNRTCYFCFWHKSCPMRRPHQKGCTQGCETLSLPDMYISPYTHARLPLDAEHGPIRNDQGETEDRDWAEEPPAEAPPADEPSSEPTGCAEAWGDFVFELNGSLQVGNVFVFYPDANFAANTACGAAAHRDKQKRRQYRCQGSTGYLFVPLEQLTIGTYGRLGKPKMRLLDDVGQLAGDWGQGLFAKQQFVQGTVPYAALLQSLCGSNAAPLCGTPIDRCF
jgi:hypothetical protein